jgi:hypothetical protein
VIKEDPATRERIWFQLTDFETKFFDVGMEELSELLTVSFCLNWANVLYKKIPLQFTCL